MEARPPDQKILGLYEWVGKSSSLTDADATTEDVDIIAVQGLGASPYYTWVKKVPTGSGSKEKEVMWLRDLLPTHVGNARIATFSYLSDWYTYRKGVETSIREIGEQLLDELHLDRQRVGATRRAIIFIGHSMGGLVIKQALVLASNRPARHDIKLSTVGIVFLGTPHGGTDIAGYAEFIAKLKGNDASLVKSLKPTSKELFALARDFEKGCGTILITCFYEKVPQTYPKALKGIMGKFSRLAVVEQHSAAPEGKDMMYLLTDHSGLNKFSGHDDPNFKLVNRVIVEMAKSVSQVVGQNYEMSRMEAAMVIPFERDEDFIGREDLLKKLRNCFSETKHLHRAALHGLGGIGKSQIAIEYAYRLREECPTTRIFWVYASSSARFEQSYRAIADAVKLPGVDEPKADILGLVFQWLESDDSGKWLMILDNADDTSVFFSQDGPEVPQTDDQIRHTTTLSSYLPRTSRGSILVTSRNRDAAFRLVGKEDRILKVEHMEEGDSKALLRKKLPNDQSAEDEWNRLVKALEFLPLAITQAAAYIAVRAPRITISDYLNHFHRNEKDQASLLSKDGGDLRRDREVPSAVIITWHISFNQIKKQNTRAADLLSRMCILDRQGIPRFLFCQDDDSDALDFEDAIGILIAYSFVVAEKDKNIFQMHPLVQLSTKKWLEAHGKLEQMKEEAVQLVSEKFPDGEPANWKTCEALEPHAQILLGHQFTSRNCRLNRAQILHNGAWHYWARGKYGIAKGRIQEAVEIRKELLGPDDVNMLGSLGLLCTILFSQGHTKKAEELEGQVMETRKRVLGHEHPHTLRSMGNLASTYWNQGRWKEAEELDVQVMETRKRVLGHEHPDTLTSMSSLAHTWKAQGRDDDAIGLLKEAESLQEKILGLDHPHTILSTQTLRECYFN